MLLLLSVSQLLSQNKANCSLLVFNKENLIESSLDFLHYLYNYYMVYVLLFHAYHVTHCVTSCDMMLWLSVIWLWHFPALPSVLSWLGKMAKSLFIFLFFSFIFLLDLQLQDGVWESITWLCHNVTMVVTVTVWHITKVTWELWERKRIATVVKCISSREISKNSIEFSLSNSEQRDSWLNSGHWTLDTDMCSKSKIKEKEKKKKNK